MARTEGKETELQITAWLVCFAIEKILAASGSWKDKSEMITALAVDRGITLEEFLSWFPDPKDHDC
jgi:hypothetical protein